MVLGVAEVSGVSGVVKDEQGKGLDKTTISLLRTKDSSVIKLAVTTIDGSYHLDVSEGTYLLSASHVGYGTR